MIPEDGAGAEVGEEEPGRWWGPWGPARGGTSGGFLVRLISCYYGPGTVQREPWQQGYSSCHKDHLELLLNSIV